MLTSFFSQSDYRESADLLMRGAANSGLCFYSVLSDAQCHTDISIDAQCALAPGYRLVRVDKRVDYTGGAFEIALLSDVDAAVVYYNKVKVASITEPSPRAATQCLAWRSTDARHAAIVSAVAHKVLFNYIIERYDILLSDNQQTGAGRFFWVRQASHAIDYGMLVYYQESGGNLQSLTTQGALTKLMDQLWSKVDEQQDHILLISKVYRDLERSGPLTIG